MGESHSVRERETPGVLTIFFIFRLLTIFNHDSSHSFTVCACYWAGGERTSAPTEEFSQLIYVEYDGTTHSCNSACWSCCARGTCTQQGQEWRRVQDGSVKATSVLADAAQKSESHAQCVTLRLVCGEVARGLVCDDLLRTYVSPNVPRVVCEATIAAQHHQLALPCMYGAA